MTFGPIVVDDTSGKFVVTSLNVPSSVAIQIATDLTPVAPPPPTSQPPSNTALWQTVPNNDWTPATQIKLGNHSYYTECAEMPYSMQISTNTTAPIVRCEVRDNELWTSAMGGNDTERAELDGSATLYPKGTEFWFAYQFMIEPGDPQIATAGGNPGGPLAWGAVGQIHGDGTESAVPWQLSIQDGNLSIRTQRGAQVETVHWTSSAPFNRNQVYDVVVRARITGNSSSTMTAWVDGVQVCNVTGLTIGGADAHNYVKCGIYRGWQGDGYPPLAVQVANVDHGTASLMSRTTNRLPWPTILAP